MASVFDHMRAFSHTKDILVKTQPVEDENDLDCLSHARQLLSFHKFHVHGIEGLVNHHDSLERRFKESEDSRKALASKLNKTEKDLKTTQTNLDTAKTDLARTRKELESKKSILKTTEQKLGAAEELLDETRSTLKSTEAKLSDTQKELGSTKDQLKDTDNKLKETTTKLTSTKTELEIAGSKLLTAQKDLEKTRKEFSQHKEEFVDYKRDVKKDIENVESELKKANDGEKTAKAQLAAEKERGSTLSNRNKSLEEVKDKALEKVRILERQLRDKSSDDSAFIHWPNRTSDDIYLDEIIYGGVNISNQTVINRLLEHAANKTKFTVTNSLMGGDPWPGTQKTFTMVYSLDGKGPFKYFSCQEGKDAWFA
ncbi:hypothetical protein ACLMJK_005624 [Lecanora helva]